MSKAILKSGFSFVFLLTCAAVLGIYLLQKQWAQAQNQTIQRADIRVIFGVLQTPVHPLGRVSLSDPDTAALLLLEASFKNDYEKVKLRSVLPEEIAKARAVINEEAEALYDFTKTFPTSFWTPPIETYLGMHFRENGRYSLALELWESVWKSLQTFDQPHLEQFAEVSLAHYLELLSSLGRYETLQRLFAQTQGRKLRHGSNQDLYNQAREAFGHMTISPGSSYLCGTYALAHAADAFYGVKEFIPRMKAYPSPNAGFSLSNLTGIALETGIDFVAAQSNGDGQIVVPSVVHWKANHYAAILSQHGSFYKVLDPTFGSSPVLLEKSYL